MPVNIPFFVKKEALHPHGEEMEGSSIHIGEWNRYFTTESGTVKLFLPQTSRTTYMPAQSGFQE